MVRRLVAIAMATVIATIAVGCSDDDGGEGGQVDEVTTTTIDRPDGPAAALTPLTGGQGVNLVDIHPADLEAAGYVEEELAAAGTATSYKAVGELPADGTFELEADQQAEYRTRIVVRRPADGADFNGTVVVEWLNVTSGIDAGPDWAFAGEELRRGGYAWVGVSAQQIGVQGGEAAIDIAGVPKGGIKAADPERYGDLVHPGDGFAFDIYTQVGRALRQPGEADPLGGLTPERFLAVGESQSAYALTTYVNGVQPLAQVFDGFLVHSRGGATLPLGAPGEVSDLAGSIGGPGTQIRTDGAAPVLVLEMESDVLGILGYHRARQPDSERFRLWEVAGTAHADAFLVGDQIGRLGCGGTINDGPQRFLVRSALRHLDEWVRTGEAPPEAPRVEVDESGAAPAYVRDADGIVEGGIRTPLVDVPVATLSGEPADTTNVLCILFGSTTPFTEAQLAERYDSPDAYLTAYEAATDQAVDAGWVLAEDREELLAMAHPEVIPG
jgi:hypothetical protein